MTDADMLRCIRAVDRRKQQGADQQREGGKFQPIASSEAIEKSASETARIVGTSRAKVERTRTVLDHGSDEVKQAVESGGMSINKA